MSRIWPAGPRKDYLNPLEQPWEHQSQEREITLCRSACRGAHPLARQVRPETVGLRVRLALRRSIATPGSSFLSPPRDAAQDWAMPTCWEPSQADGSAWIAEARSDPMAVPPWVAWGAA